MAIPSKVQAIITDIFYYGDTIIEYTCKPLNRIPNFQPGQFLHLAIDKYDPSFEWPESRVFSIANGNESLSELKIIISVKGKFTTRMKDEISIGKNVWLKLPYGDFTFKDVNKDLVLIAGGTGISPFLSFIRSKEFHSFNYRVYLYYGVRNSEQFILKDLTGIKENLDVFLYNENKINDHIKNVEHGIININNIYSRHKNNGIYYISGPWKMIENFREKLTQENLPVEQIKIDAWE